MMFSTFSSGHPEVTAGLPRVPISTRRELVSDRRQTVAVAASYSDQFFTDKMESYDFGAGLLLEMTDHRIANHLV